MRIPTLLGLILLIATLGVGIIFYNYQQNLQKISNPEIPPKSINVVNITDNSATIIWLTSLQTTGLLTWGNSPNLGNSQPDDRDKGDPKKHFVHFSTIKDLNPETDYYYKVRSGLFFYPDSVLKFRTAKKLPDDKFKADTPGIKPIIGVVVNLDQTPVDEALVTLKLPGAADLSTLTTTAGNFILPLTSLYVSSFDDLFPINQLTPAKLIVSRADLKSSVRLNLPMGDSPLPQKIVLGQDLDLLEQTATMSGLEKMATESGGPKNPYDLNHDGKVNAHDLSILLDLLGKTIHDKDYRKDADLDHDGVIDQKDVDLMKQHVSPKE